MENISRMKELITEICKADTAYYKYDNEIMPDVKYDKLRDELRGLEEQTGIVMSNSPLHRVSGEVLESLQAVPHSKPMLSADKANTYEDIAAFASNKETGKCRAVTVSPKIDGLTLVLRYNKGLLQQGLTRGGDGGLIGEDVTHAVRVMANVPMVIPELKPLEVRGEGVLSWESFERINNELVDEPFLSIRSAASGSVRRLDATVTKEYGIEFLAFDITGGDTVFRFKHEQLSWLSSQGFDTVPFRYVPEGSDNQVLIDAIEAIDPTSYRFPLDGAIIEHDDVEYGRSLGATGHHENRLIAFKWPDKTYETTLKDIKYKTTRTGMISLTAILEPVAADDGTTITHAYLHNIDYILALELGIGDRVTVYKANMLIPQIRDNLTRSGTLKLPDTCPSCGGASAVEKTSANGNSAHILRCNNGSCPSKLIQKFVHFCTKSRMNVKGVSEKTLATLIENGLVKNYGDLFKLEQHYDELVTFPGFGEKSVRNLLDTFDNARRCKLNQFLSGLGIHTIGRTASRQISDYFNGSWDAFEEALQIGFNFTQLQDFGPTMHENLHTWYRDSDAAMLWRPALEVIEIIKEERIIEMASVFNGKIVVATGKLEGYTRDGIQAELLRLGAKPSGSVSKKTDYLIVGEAAGSKLDKAQSLGVTILSEAQFEEMKNREQEA